MWLSILFGEGFLDGLSIHLLPPIVLCSTLPNSLLPPLRYS